MSSSKNGLRARIMESHNNSDDIVCIAVLLVMLSCIIEIFEIVLTGIDVNLIELIHICSMLTIKAIIGSVLIDNLTMLFNILIVSNITQCTCANNKSFGIDKYDTLWLMIIDITSKLIEFDTITRNGFKTTPDLFKMINVVSHTQHISSFKNLCLNRHHVNPVGNCWYSNFLVDCVLTVTLSCITIQFRTKIDDNVSIYIIENDIYIKIKEKIKQKMNKNFQFLEILLLVLLKIKY